MSEAKVISQTPSPRTRESLATDLCQLGLTPGAIVLVHSSLKSLGWVCGGPVTHTRLFLLRNAVDWAVSWLEQVQK